MISLGVVIVQLRKYGGAERFLLECLLRWQDRFDITLYATEINSELLREVGVDRIECRTLSPMFEGPHDILLNATLLPKLWQREIGQHDVYHTHLWPTHLIDRHPVVWYPHEPLRMLYDLRFHQGDDDDAGRTDQQLHFYPKQSYDTVPAQYRDALFDVLAKHDQLGRPDRIVANSRLTANYLEAVYGRAVPDIVYPGVTIADAIDMPSHGDIVLAIGQLWPHKRLRLIIEAIHQVEGVQAYLVGSGPERARLQDLAERLGVSDRVFFLQDVDNEDVQILLARCFCVVFTPIREPFGIVALEALAAGKPLIAVNEGGFTEVVNAECAVLVPPSPARIALEIQRLKDDPERVAAMGRAGREVARQYSWDLTATRLGDMIEETYLATRPVTAELEVPEENRPLLGAHYFNWYREGYGAAHWSDQPATGGVTDIPSLGYYSSGDGETMSEHLRLFEAAGLDFIVFNLHVGAQGLDLFQFANAEKMMRLAKHRRSRLRFAVNLCLYTRDVAALEAAINRIRTNFFSDPAALRIGGQPVLFLFWSGAFDRDWSVVQTLTNRFDDALRIGVMARPFEPKAERTLTRALFQVAVPFSPLEIGEPENWERSWQAALDHSEAFAAGISAACVSPGYDDRHLTGASREGNPYRFVDRDEGATYQRMIDFVQRQPVAPRLTIVTSFNEFHENSQIEPSVHTGDLYLNLTRALADHLGATATVREGAPVPSNEAIAS